MGTEQLLIENTSYRAWWFLARAYHSVAGLATRLFVEHGITGAQFCVVRCLADVGAILDRRGRGRGGEIGFGQRAVSWAFWLPSGIRDATRTLPRSPGASRVRAFGDGSGIEWPNPACTGTPGQTTECWCAIRSC